jgi:hypothetical protein
VQRTACDSGKPACYELAARGACGHVEETRTSPSCSQVAMRKRYLSARLLGGQSLKQANAPRCFQPYCVQSFLPGRQRPLGFAVQDPRSFSDQAAVPQGRPVLACQGNGPIPCHFQVPITTCRGSNLRPRPKRDARLPITHKRAVTARPLGHGAASASGEQSSASGGRPPLRCHTVTVTARPLALALVRNLNFETRASLLGVRSLRQSLARWPQCCQSRCSA